MDLAIVEDPDVESLPIRRATRGIVLHRLGKLGTQAQLAIDAYRKHWHHHKIAYHTFIDHAGRVTVVEDIGRKRYHAGAANDWAIGIAFLCDGRFQAATRYQLNAAVEYLASLCRDHSIDPLRSVYRHDEIVGGSKYPDKVCPGPGIPVEWIAMQVQAMLRDGLI